LIPLIYIKNTKIEKKMKIEYNIDVLKPHQPSNDMLARALKKVEGAKFVSIKTDEIDSKTTSIYVKIVGTEELTIENIEEELSNYNCSLHSLDEVTILDDDWEK